MNDETNQTPQEAQPETQPDAPAGIPGEAAREVMVDIETLGTEPGAPVLAIGAVRFDLGEGDLIVAEQDTFYQVITLESCLAVGMRPSASTINWWMDQSKEAQAIFNDPTAVALPVALDAFTEWLAGRPDTLWGNSARFDLGLINAAYKMCGLELPWLHYNEGCYRTMKNRPAVKHIELVRYGTHHNALHDAISQALHLRAIDAALRK